MIEHCHCHQGFQWWLCPQWQRCHQNQQLSTWTWIGFLGPWGQFGDQQSHLWGPRSSSMLLGTIYFKQNQSSPYPKVRLVIKLVFFKQNLCSPHPMVRLVIKLVFFIQNLCSPYPMVRLVIKLGFFKNETFCSLHPIVRLGYQVFFLGKKTWNFVQNLQLSLIIASIQMFFKSLPLHVQNKVHDMFWTLFYMLF